jgi:hypothetical protein
VHSRRQEICRWCVCLAFALAVSALSAQSPSMQTPAAPKLLSISPPGVTARAASEIELTGANLSHAIALGAPLPARATTPSDDTPGKDSTKSRWMLEPGQDEAIGWHRLRLLTAQGMSNFRVFCVDSLPHVVSNGTSRTKQSAQVITVPCVVSGQVAAETSEHFRFAVTAGQRLSFEVLGRRLGSSLDPWIQLYDAKTGREMTYGYCDDAPGLQTDARLTYKFANAGEYLVEVRDATHRGGADFRYCLRIGDFPCAIAPLPLAVTRGRKVPVGFAGPQVDGVAPVDVQAPSAPDIHAINVVPRGSNGIPGWPVTLLVSDMDEILAPDSLPTEGLVLPVPSGVTSRFLRKSQVDHYRFAARKGQKYIVTVQTTEFLSPAELFLALRDSKGAVITKSDPNKSARLEFSAAEDGEHAIQAEHINYAFGPNEIYRLTITQPTPGFDLTLGADSVVVPQGQGALIPIQTLSRRDFSGPIDLTIVGANGLSGSIPVSPGAESGPPPAAGQPSGAPFAMLPIRAAPDLAPGVYEIQVQAKALLDGKEIVSFAGTDHLIRQSMAGLPFPPRTWSRKVAVGVLPKPPFEISARFEPPEIVRGATTNLVVTAKRDANFDQPITLSPAGLPANVTASAKTLDPASSETRLEVTLSDRAALGSYSFTLLGRSQVGDRPVMASILAPSLIVVRPFELKVAPNPVTITQGEKATLTVTAVRKGGYEGPIEVELRNLPAQTSAATAKVAQGETSTQIELSATPAAPIVARGDVDVLGTVGQQQFASPPFAVKVQPPTPTLQLKAEPASVVLKPGGKAKIKVAIERKHVAGPVTLSLTGLPPHVTAADVTVPADQSVGEIEVVVAAAEIMPAKVEAAITGKVGVTSNSAKLVVQLEKVMDR